MLYYLALFGILFGIIYGKPLSSCSSQMGCMALRSTEQEELDSDGNKQYELCLIFDRRAECLKKEGSISHACPSEKEEDKIEGWGEGEANAMCNIVSCDGVTYFGVKDGSTCDGESVYGDMGVPGYDEYIYCYSVDDESYSGGSCGGGKKTKQCRYVIPAPKCDDDDSTTTAVPDTDTTTSTPDDGTTTAETTTAETTSEPCECAMEYEDEGFNDECKARCGGDVCRSTSPGPDAECIAAAPADPTASTVYVRDEQTDENSNLNFVIDNDTEDNTENTNDAHKLIKQYMGALIVTIIVYLF